MTEHIVGVTSAASGEATITVQTPAGTQVGHVLVALLRAQSGAQQWTADGWAVIGPPWESSSQRANAILARTVTQADLDREDQGWTFVAPAHVRQVVALVALRQVTLPASGRTPSYAGVDIPSGRGSEPFPASAESLVLWAAGSEFAAGNAHTPTSTPAGYTQVGYAVTTEQTTISRSYVWVGQQTVAPGTVPAASITWGSPSGQAVQAVALPIVAEPDQSGPGLPIAIVDTEGIPRRHRLYVATDDGPRTPARLITIPAGYPSVQAMLAGECWWAHRGGSHSYPEHSLYAYTQSVIRGYGALEVSLARTLDGHWIGLHDLSIDRTSGITGSPPASAMTWAEIQTHQIVTGQHGAPQPYMLWDDLIEAYGDSHVLVCDPKHAVTEHRTEFLDRCVQDIGVDRCIVKWSAGLTSLADAASARGLVTWGYAYADELDTPGFTGHLAHWDLLGMEHSAPPLAWSVMLDQGKPVIAHICRTQADVDTARARGAAGYQCSGTATITPGS